MPRKYLQKGYSYSFDPVGLQSEFMTKNYRQRAYFDNPDTVFNVRENMTSSEFAEFEGWVRNTLDYGAQSFNANYWDGDVEKTGTGHIVGGDYSFNYIAPNAIQVSYQLEIKDRDLTNGQNLYESFIAGVPFNSDYLRQVELTVNGV